MDFADFLDESAFGLETGSFGMPTQVSPVSSYQLAFTGSTPDLSSPSTLSPITPADALLGTPLVTNDREPALFGHGGDFAFSPSSFGMPAFDYSKVATADYQATPTIAPISLDLVDSQSPLFGSADLAVAPQVEAPPARRAAKRARSQLKDADDDDEYVVGQDETFVAEDDAGPPAKKGRKSSSSSTSTGMTRKVSFNRQYHGETKTSLKPVNDAGKRRQAALLRQGIVDEEELDFAGLTGSELKRKKDAAAQRQSRARKAQLIDDLQMEVATLRATLSAKDEEIAQLKARLGEF